MANATYRVGLYDNTSKALLFSKEFTVTAGAGASTTAITNAQSDQDFLDRGYNGSTTTLRVIDRSDNLLLITYLLGIYNSIYSAINSALASFGVIGGVLNDSSPTSATEGNVAPVRLTALRAFHTNLRNASGTEIGTTSNPVNTKDAGLSKTVQRASISIATSGDNSIISAPGGGLAIKIISLYIENTSDTDLTVILKSASTALNGAGYYIAKPASTLSLAPSFREFNAPGGVGQGEMVLGTNEAFQINLSAAKQLSGFVIYRTDA